MSNITKFKGSQSVVVAMPAVSSLKMVAVIAGDLPPTLPEGQTLTSWLDQAQSFIGSHPEAVLADARDAILSTFVFAPKKSEIIQHVLDAYQRLGIPLSEDGKRHLAFRKKMPARYTLNANGIKRFADDAKVTLVGYFTVQGPQANIIIDETPGAIVDDVERAIGPVVRAFSGTDKGDVHGDAVLARFRDETAVQRDYRLVGTPAELCGGPVGVVVGPSGNPCPLAMNYFSVSQAFVDRMRETYPNAKAKFNGDGWGSAMIEAFYRASPTRHLKHCTYGGDMQVEAEKLIERALAELADS